MSDRNVDDKNKTWILWDNLEREKKNTYQICNMWVNLNYVYIYFGADANDISRRDTRKLTKKTTQKKWLLRTRKCTDWGLRATFAGLQRFMLISGTAFNSYILIIFIIHRK